MTPEAQRLAIAEACGYKRVQFVRAGNSFLEHPDRPASHYKGERMKRPTGALVFPGPCHVPDYLFDLNAMHEAEKVLTEQQWTDYIEQLKTLLRAHTNTYGSVKKKVHATAAQRAEAFLRTLNLWKP